MKSRTLLECFASALHNLTQAMGTAKHIVGTEQQFVFRSDANLRPGCAEVKS